MKLTKEQKAAIIAKYNGGKGMTKGELARIYNVSDRTIRRVVEA